MSKRKNKKGKKKNNKKNFLIITATILIFGFAIGYYHFSLKERFSVQPLEKPEPGVDVLSLYHWWTSPSEEAALNALLDFFTEKYPDIIIFPTPIKGGGGFTMLEIVKSMIKEGTPPDVFQIHAGYESEPYYKAGLLEPIDEIWKGGQLEHVIPAVVQDMNKFEGHYFSVPINIHRTNVVWYNIELLEKNNIDPEQLNTWEQFFEACEKLRKSGLEYPVQIAFPWTVSHAFEQIMASMGIDFYEDWINGKINSPGNNEQLEALNIFKKYLSYTNPDYENLEWDEAADRILKGEGAFYIMGDWVNGEYTQKGAKKGIDYGTFPVPGTENIYGLCIDTFEHPKEMLHHKNADKWLTTASSKEGMDTFNSLKGSISARTDADISKYNEYQQSAMRDFWSAKYMFPSIVHGSGAPEDFKLKMKEVIAEFAKDKDIEKTDKALSAFTLSIQDQYTIPWSLK